MYRTRHRAPASGTGSNISRLSDHRKAVSVLPLPVGARISVESPRAIGGQPRFCGAVASANTAWNHWSTAGWKRPTRLSNYEMVVRAHPAHTDPVAPGRVRTLPAPGTCYNHQFMGDAGEGLIDAE